MSKIYKISSGRASEAEPFVPESLGGRSVYPEKNGVGGSAEAVERAAYERGFSAGEKAGIEFGRKKAEVTFQGLEGIVGELRSFRERLLKECEEEMTGLAIAIARKVVQGEVGVRKDVVLDAVRAAMKALVASGEIIVRVNPKDLEVIHQYRGELARFTDGVKGVQIEADDSIGRGGCIVETDFGEVDATLEGVMGEIEERLRRGE